MKALVAAAALLASGCATLPASGPAASTVEAEGWAPAGAEARAASLADALKRAVEQATGVRVQSATTVEKSVATRRRIWAGGAGVIERYEVLGVRAEDGFLKTRVRAVVRPLDAPAAPPAEAKVVVSGSGPGAAAVRRALAARGYAVVREGGAFVARSRVVSAAEVRDERVAPMRSRRALLTLEVEDAATGETVWSGSREAGGLAGDELAAADRAAESAGELAGGDAADGLTAYLWKR